MPKFALSIICSILGAATPFAFAPYELWFVIFAVMPAAFLLIGRDGPKEAFRRGWWFASGMFLHGIYWLYHSVRLEMPDEMAMVATAGLSFFLALYYAIACWLALKIKANKGITLAILLPATWVLFEWLRGLLFSGFPWLSIGYSQVDSPLGGYAPVLGVYGVSLITLLVVGLFSAFAYAASKRAIAPRYYAGLLGALALLLGGAALQTQSWTQPDGDSYKVALLQGNIPQRLKWKDEEFGPTLALYDRLNIEALENEVDLIVWPEVAMPGLFTGAFFIKGQRRFDVIKGQRIRNTLRGLERISKQKKISILSGALFYNAERARAHNTMWLLDESGRRTYHKRHLVPFGELFPGGDTVRNWVKSLGIPVKDILPGDSDQPPLTFKGKPFNLSICFEDVFGEEIAADMPDAAFLVNVTNDAWFADSIEPQQHLQIARMRTIETGRYMLRATQTGITAIIDARGKIVQTIPQFETGVLIGELKTYEGATPYSIWRNWLMLAMVFVLLLAGTIVGRRRA